MCCEVPALAKFFPTNLTLVLEFVFMNQLDMMVEGVLAGKLLAPMVTGIVLGRCMVVFQNVLP